MVIYDISLKMNVCNMQGDSETLPLCFAISCKKKEQEKIIKV